MTFMWENPPCYLFEQHPILISIILSLFWIWLRNWPWRESPGRLFCCPAIWHSWSPERNASKKIILLDNWIFPMNNNHKDRHVTCWGFPCDDKNCPGNSWPYTTHIIREARKLNKRNKSWTKRLARTYDFQDPNVRF